MKLLAETFARQVLNMDSDLTASVGVLSEAKNLVHSSNRNIAKNELMFALSQTG